MTHTPTDATGDPPRLTFQDLCEGRPSLVEALAGLYHAESRARTHLLLSGYDSSGIPWTGAVPFWTAACRDITNGATTAGVEAVLARAAGEFPGNSRLAPWRGSPGGAERQLGVTAGAHDVPARRPRSAETFPRDVIELLALLYADRPEVAALCERAQERSLNVPGGTSSTDRWQGVWSHWAKGGRDPSFSVLVRHVVAEHAGHPMIEVLLAWCRS